MKVTLLYYSKQERACPEREHLTGSHVLVAHLDFGVNICVFFFNLMSRMLILKYFAHEVLFEQLTATNLLFTVTYLHFGNV